MALDRPPLGLHAEVVRVDGSTVRWDSDSRAGSIPTGVSFRTKRFDGFADAAVTLHRRIDGDYPDLRLLGGVNLIGYDGSVAYEGRIASMPRTVATGQGHQIAVQTQGWMSSARDRPFVEVYVDRDLQKWGPMSRQRRVNALSVNYGKVPPPTVLTSSTGAPVVETSFADDWASPFKPLAEAWWLPEANVTIGKIYYNFSGYSPNMTPSDVNWGVSTAILPDDVASGGTSSPQLWPTLGGAYLTAAGHAAYLQLAYAATAAGTAGAIYAVYWSDLAVYGNHGLMLRGSNPGGVYASDVIADIVSRFCPSINATAITPTTFVIPHLSFLQDIDPYDAFLEINKYHRFGLEVYENRGLRFAPIDLTDYDWEVRISDPGTTVQFQGDDAANLANGVVVHYRDLATGRNMRLDPVTFPALADAAAGNPANVAGINKWTQLTLSSPTSQAGALQIGGAFLAEFNKSQAPGTITVTGHIRDRAGHWQQGWKVRAGDRVSVTDFPNDRPRIITETDWQHDSKTLRIAVESTFKRLDAVLDRIGVALTASNLSLP